MTKILPVGTHGFNLPSIKIWNDFWKATQESIKDGFKLDGSVEDLLINKPDAVCDDCGKKLIRVSGLTDGYFLSGMICCPANYKKGHSQIGWLEVWPDANANLTRQELLDLTSDERTDNRYKLSDSRIKECFSDILFVLYTPPQKSKNKMPDPLYVHK